jgi:hypothetical protein
MNRQPLEQRRRSCLSRDGTLHAAASESLPLIGEWNARRPIPVMARCYVGKRHASNAPASLSSKVSRFVTPTVLLTVADVNDI